MDWDDVRTFLAIARSRSLSGAARDLAVSQSTMSRRLVALEQRVGARLLLKTPGGYELTGLGEAVLGNAERMEAEAISVERAVQGRDVALSGLVRVTTVDVVATRLLPAAIALLRRRYPGISLDVLPESRSLSLSRREADIAIRMARFEGMEVFSRRMATMTSALYASRTYREARPEALDHEGHSIVTVLEDQDHQPEARWLHSSLPAATVAMRTNSREAQLAAVVAGIGVACLPSIVGDAAPGLLRLDEAGTGPGREVWLGVHADLRHMPRIRAVIDAIEEAFVRQRGTLASGA